ncbi:TetR/AcrR family transcriptional regulator [Segetibacter sp. 3557_3]|uniref:TetR/AcrR family transcriptional regulator n=1 Tax=Segetibacter sp. 3557_3 TaxID=2547429 RepID=UPI00105902EA|nr:TetR/AcrR family transcriptional regulator [Segetibacter sp. 3557_3]TDH26564.1 TetR/AcrR family transcriptional regulator [Segetibacter sp. 3557_3]
MVLSDKQLQILETAEKLFASKGFDGTSVRDIAEEAGVNLAMISYYFGSKLKLMEAIFEKRSMNVRERVDHLLQNSALEPMDKMYLLVDEYISRVMEKQQFFKIMLCEQVVNKNPVIIKLINELKFKNAESITRLIKDGQKRGAFKKNIDVVFMMSTMIGTITQVMISQDYYREFHNLQSLSDEQFDTHIKKKLGTYIKTIFKEILSYEG